MRVGDRVRRINEPYAGMNVGDTGIVTSIAPRGICIDNGTIYFDEGMFVVVEEGPAAPQLTEHTFYLGWFRTTDGSVYGSGMQTEVSFNSYADNLETQGWTLLKKQKVKVLL